MLKKKTFLAGMMLIFLLAGALSIQAQHVELTPFVGYETGAKLNSYNYGDIHIDGGMNYGGLLSVGPNSSTMFEFGYNHLRSNLNSEIPYNLGSNFDLDVDYFMFGVVKELKPGPVTPFFSAALGWVNYRTLDEAIDNENFFNVDFSGGIKIKANERFGIKLQARLHLPMLFEGIYFTAGTGGAGAGLGATAIFVQGDFNGGIYFIIK